MSDNMLSNNNLAKEVKSLAQICPKCGGNCNLNNDGFFIISECENNHKLKCSIKEFEKKQIIRVSVNKIFCDICSVEEKDNIFYYCLQCGKKLCKSCKDHHIFSDKNCSKKIIEYIKFIRNNKYCCQEHNELFLDYCSDCKKDICSQCLNAHNSHKVNEYNLNMKEIKAKLDKNSSLREKVNSIFYNKFEQLEKYLKEIKDTCEIVAEKNKNIGEIRTMQELNNLKSFDIDLINERFQNIININNNEKDILKVLDSFIQFHKEITNPDFEKLNNNLCIKKESELNFLANKYKETKENVMKIEKNNKKINFLANKYKEIKENVMKIEKNDKKIIFKENIKSKEKNKIKNNNSFIIKKIKKANISIINSSYTYNNIIYAKMSSNTYFFQSCSLINNVSEIYKNDINKAVHINNIFQIKNIIYADNEFNYSSKSEEVDILFESSPDYWEDDIGEKFYDDSNCNNNEINSIKIMENYLKFIGEDSNKEKLENSKFPSNTEFNQNNKNDSNSKFTFGIKISTIQRKNKNNEGNDSNNSSEKKVINEIDDSDKNSQKPIIINLKFVNEEEFNKDKSNNNKLKKRIKRNRIMKRRKNIIYNIKIIRFNINNIKLDYIKIILKCFSANKNIENKFLYIISFISNIICFNSNYNFKDIFRRIVNTYIIVSYNHSRINILFSLKENESGNITFLTNCIIIFYIDRGKMIEFIYPYGFIISNILYKLNKDFLYYLLSL